VAEDGFGPGFDGYAGDVSSSAEGVIFGEVFTVEDGRLID
jgi:hypothetical protein